MSDDILREAEAAFAEAASLPVLDQVKAERGLPKVIRTDNGPEFAGRTMQTWAARNGVELRFIQPGKPTQNAYIERFNRTYREEVVNAYLFHSTQEAQALSDAWLVDYNERRPHDALGRVPPLTYLPRVSTPSESSHSWSA